jgi:hypothetical protein
MDFFVAPNCAQPLLSYLLPYSRRSIALVKRLAGSPKGWNWSQPATLTKCYSRYILIYMDFFQSHQTVPKPLLSYLLPYSRTFNCTSKTTGWFTKRAEIDPNLPHANKVLLQGSTRILIHWWTSFNQTVPKPLLSYLLPYSRTFNCTSKTTGWFTKGLKLINTLTKVLLKVAHSYIHWWTSFSRTKLCPSRCYLTFFHIPERSIALVKRLAGSPKGWRSQPAPR